MYEYIHIYIYALGSSWKPRSCPGSGCRCSARPSPAALLPPTRARRRTEASGRNHRHPLTALFMDPLKTLYISIYIHTYFLNNSYVHVYIDIYVEVCVCVCIYMYILRTGSVSLSLSAYTCIHIYILYVCVLIGCDKS